MSTEDDVAAYLRKNLPGVPIYLASPPTLTEFLLARIAEREAVARDMEHQAAIGRPFFDVGRLAGGTGIRELIEPARVLAECEAKRAIVDLAYLADEEGAEPIYLRALRALAAVYAEHPDYRGEWRL